MVYGLIPYTQMPANADRYTMRLGVPEPAVLQMMTATWCICSWIAVVASLVLIIGVLSCQKARGASFNLFLVGLAVPDLLLNMSSGITFTINLTDAAFTGSLSAARCDWQGEFKDASRARMFLPSSARLRTTQQGTSYAAAGPLWRLET